MNTESVAIIKDVIANWLNEKNYDHLTKDFIVGRSRVYKEEFVFRFFLTLENFHYNGEIIKLNHSSNIFYTTTFGKSLSQDLDYDKARLERFLKQFDEEFDIIVQEKLIERGDYTFNNGENGFF